MTHATAGIIRNEHAALRAVLRSIPLLLDEARRADRAPPFDTLRAMLLYVDEFPDQRHHMKETELLFPMLRARAPLARPLLDDLDREHLQGGRKIRALEHALLAFEVMGETRRPPFEQAARDFIDFYLAHMALEEREVLPLAERVLTPDDWMALDAAFLSNRDPLTGHKPEADYQALFQRIVIRTPAPVGLGPAAC